MLFLPSHLPTAHVRRPPPPEGGRVITRGVVKIESCLFLSTSTEGHGPILGGGIGTIPEGHRGRVTHVSRSSCLDLTLLFTRLLPHFSLELLSRV